MLEPTLANTVGALEIGSLFATYLFGLISFQTQYYLVHFQEDNSILRLVVIFLWFCEAGHTIGNAYEVYRSTILGPHFVVFPGIYVAVLMSATITMSVHIYLSLRVFKALQKPWNYIIGLTPIALTIARTIATLYLIGRLFASDNFIETMQELSALVTAILSSGAGIDVIIAGGMSYYLATQREKTFQRSQKLIDRLIRFSIRSGLLTSITAVTMLTVFRIVPRTFIWLAIYTCLAKLYSITMLSALNGREELRHQMSGYPTGSDIPSNSRAKVNILKHSSTHGKNCTCGCRVKPTSAISIEMRTTTDVNGSDGSFFHLGHEKASDALKRTLPFSG